MSYKGLDVEFGIGQMLSAGTIMYVSPVPSLTFPKKGDPCFLSWESVDSRLRGSGTQHCSEELYSLSHPRSCLAPT